LLSCELKTGEGIPPEIMPRIFDPYFTTKPVKEGTGLGLAIVHGIVKNSGGFIKVKSQVGKGTTFEIFFPLINPPQAKESSSTLSQEKGKGERILLLEDDEQNLKALSEALTFLEYQVRACSTCEEALLNFFADPQNYDLAILDLLLPGGRGDLVAQILKETRPDLPIILLTGFKDKIQSEFIEKILYKPISLNELAKAIRELLEQVSQRKKIHFS